MAKRNYLCSPHMGGGEMKYLQEAFGSISRQYQSAVGSISWQ